MKKLHENVRTEIENANEKYKKKANKNQRFKYFELGDLDGLQLRNERFLGKLMSKLMQRAEGSSMILEKFSDNAYKIDFPSSYGILVSMWVIFLHILRIKSC
ncbi:hypothetical protein V5N11_019953 [Cardamine amara subsp. amara]|uniref:Uncharacterized protein n=1 Tax=Cardamine amara subsp. amara TaxID=228776 RepID=A0ABD1A9A5_CARAN